MTKAHQYTVEILKIFDDIDKDRNKFANILGECDSRRADILHQLEEPNLTFNMYEGYLIAKRLQEICHERRNIKNEYEPLRNLSDTIHNANICNLLKRIQESITRLEKRTLYLKINEKEGE